MYKYTLLDGNLVKTEIESDKTLTEMINRAFAPAIEYSYDRYYCGGGYKYAAGRKNRENSIFDTGLGTKAFLPGRFTKWDSTRKCFIWKDNGKVFDVYDASNVRLTIRGFYILEFDVSKLPNAKNQKANKKRYVLMNTYCEDLLADCKMLDKRAMSDTAFDYTRQDRFNEYRAVWAVRQLITKAFKENKRISAGTLTEMFINTSYASEFPSAIYTFGEFVKSTGQELIDKLTAETGDGKSGGGRPDSDDGRP